MIFRKNFASLSHRLQRIPQQIHQNNIRMLYKPGPQLFITDWLSRHHNERNRGEKVLWMFITVNATVSCMDISDFMSAEEIKEWQPYKMNISVH